MDVSSKLGWEAAITPVKVVVSAPPSASGSPLVVVQFRDEPGDTVGVVLVPAVAVQLVEDVLREAMPATGMTPEDALGWVLALEEASERIRDAYALVRATERPASGAAGDGPKPQDE